MRAIAVIPLAALVGSLSFIIGASLFFPDERALDYVRWKVEESSRGSWAVGASDLDWQPLTGLALDDATLYKLERPRRVRGEEIPGTPTPVLQSGRASARLKLLPLLTGALMMGINAELYGGDLDITAGKDGDMRVLEGSLDDVDLSRVPFDGDDWQLDVTGLAQCDADLHIDTGTIKDSEGTLTLRLDKLAIGGGQISGFNVEPMTFTEAVLAFKIEDGEARVTEGRMVSDMLTATITGEITLNKDFRRSRVHLLVALELNEELDKLARFVPALSDARDDEGIYHLIMSGTPATARFRGDRLAARGEASASPRRIDGPGFDDNPDDEAIDDGSEDDAKTRREKRLDRIRKARERRQKEREENGEAPMAGPGRVGGPRGGFEPMMPGGRGGVRGGTNDDEDLPDHNPVDEELNQPVDDPRQDPVDEAPYDPFDQPEDEE